MPTLLSQALVAFTIEFDNEAEQRSMHSTTRGPAAGKRGPWLTSQAMWANFMQFIDEGRVLLSEVEGLAAITNLSGLKRWGYITVAPEPADGGTGLARADLVVRPTRAGRSAQEILRPLAAEIEQRWVERFGSEQISSLRGHLASLVDRFDVELPPYLPVVSIHMFSGTRALNGRVPEVPGAGPGLAQDLSVLLAKVLLMFTIDFEAESKLSLPTSANALRVLDEKGVRVRDLPRLTGVSKEALAMSVGLLARLGCVVVEPDPTASRGKVVRLTAKGPRPRTSTGESSPTPSNGGRSASATTTLRGSAPRSSRWSQTAPHCIRRCSRACSLTLTAGVRRCAARRPCRTIPWCCTGAGTPTAADQHGIRRSSAG